MSFEIEIDGDVVEYGLNLEYDEKTDEYVAMNVIDGEEQRVGRGSSINRAVAALARSMEEEIQDAL